MYQTEMIPFVKEGAAERYTKLLVFNAIIAFFIWQGVVLNHEWAGNIVLFWTWASLVVSAIAAPAIKADTREQIVSLSRKYKLGAFDRTYFALCYMLDIIFVGVLVAHAWWFTAVAATIAALLSTNTHQLCRDAYNKQFSAMFSQPEESNG